MKVHFILLIGSLALWSKYGYVEAAPNSTLYVWAHPNRNEWPSNFLENHSDWKALRIGTDYDGYGHFVGRAHFQGELLPGKWEFTPNWFQRITGIGLYKIWVAQGSEEYELSVFESLWTHPCAASYIQPISQSIPSLQDPPDDAIIGGYTRDHEPIYIGKFKMETDDGPIEVPSKIIRSTKKMYGTYGGHVKEEPIKNYIVVRREENCPS